MVILSQGRFSEILYIDGFAGPGEYAGGETGSPIIALDTAPGYRSPLTAKLHFLFVEKDDALIPAFAFIDPFGWTGAPFSLVAKILTQRSREVFVNVMCEEVT